MTATTQLVEAPPCPPWCTDHQPGAGWDDEAPNDIIKFCHGTVEAPGGVTVRVSRWAALTGSSIEIDHPEIRVDWDDGLSAADAFAAAEVIRQTAETLARVVNETGDGHQQGTAPAR